MTKILKKLSLTVSSSCPKCYRSFTSSAVRLRSKKDLNYAEKMPVYEYSQVNRDKNRLYVFGTANHGAIGLERLMRPKEVHEKIMHFMWKPVRHKFAENHALTHIAAGHGFSLFAIKAENDNRPFVFGCGKNHSSQIGYQAAKADSPMETLLSVVPLPLAGQKGTRVLALGAGRAHSLISVAGEGLYTLGDNSNGQCGRRIIPDELYFGSKYLHKLTRFVDDQVVNISSRFDLSLCITESGKVFSCGANEKGQLGRGKSVERPWEFRQVKGDLEGEKVTKVATSGSSVLALTDKGELFSWGCNEMGQADPSEFGTVNFHPKLVKLSRGIGKVTDVAIGDYFSLLLNLQGNVYAWGQGSCLGLGPTTTLVKSPTQIPPPLFGCNQFSPDVQVISIAASFFYCGAINTLGELYTWGKNFNGCGGLGDIKHQYFPYKVSLGGSAKKMSLGIDHTLVIARGI